MKTWLTDSRVLQTYDGGRVWVGLLFVLLLSRVTGAVVLSVKIQTIECVKVFNAVGTMNTLLMACMFSYAKNYENI